MVDNFTFCATNACNAPVTNRRVIYGKCSGMRKALPDGIIAGAFGERGRRLPEISKRLRSRCGGWCWERPKSLAISVSSNLLGDDGGHHGRFIIGLTY
ncbi:hypothetical protein LQ948_03315 [Jiella sp. MQZ9-1]|nr:hypothetical protein [Jiella flava]